MARWCPSRGKRGRDLTLSVAAEAREDQPGQGDQPAASTAAPWLSGAYFSWPVLGIAAEEALATLIGARSLGEAHITVGVDGQACGVIVMADELRPDSRRIVERCVRKGSGMSRWCRRLSFGRSTRVGRELGVDRAYAEAFTGTSSTSCVGSAPIAAAGPW